MLVKFLEQKIYNISQRNKLLVSEFIIDFRAEYVINILKEIQILDYLKYIKGI